MTRNYVDELLELLAKALGMQKHSYRALRYFPMNDIIEIHLNRTADYIKAVSIITEYLGNATRKSFQKLCFTFDHEENTIKVFTEKNSERIPIIDTSIGDDIGCANIEFKNNYWWFFVYSYGFHNGLEYIYFIPKSREQEAPELFLPSKDYNMTVLCKLNSFEKVNQIRELCGIKPVKEEEYLRYNLL